MNWNTANCMLRGVFVMRCALGYREDPPESMHDHTLGDLSTWAEAFPNHQTIVFCAESFMMHGGGPVTYGGPIATFFSAPPEPRLWGFHYFCKLNLYHFVIGLPARGPGIRVGEVVGVRWEKQGG